MEEDGRGEFFEAFNKYWVSTEWDGFDSMFYNAKVIYAKPGRIKFEFIVTKDVLNAMGILHGGCTATLLDVLVLLSGWEPSRTSISQAGVTVDMTIAYMSAAKLGDVLIIDCQKLRAGKSIGFYKGEMYRKSDGEMIAASQQTNIPAMSKVFQRGNLKYFNALQKFWGRSQWQGFQELFSTCELVYAEPGRVKYEFPVLKSHTDTSGALHGGCIFTLLDVCLSTAIFDPDKNVNKQTGVTVAMSVSYLNPAPIGETVVIDCETLKKNGNLAFFHGQIYRKSDGVSVAVSTQTLAVIDEKKDS